MLAFLGWNPGTAKEIYTLEELINDFSLERVGKSGSKFDSTKTIWFNQQYLRNKSNSELAKIMITLVDHNVSIEFLEGVAKLMKERASFVSELIEDDYYFLQPKNFDAKTIRKKWKEDTPNVMINLLQVLSNINEFTSSNIEFVFKEFLELNELKMGQVLPNFRLIVTGEAMGPSMFEIAELLGKKEVISRFNIGIDKVSLEKQAS